MSLIAQLMETAVADTDVLRSLDANGDVFGIFREVDFLFVAPSLEKAQLLAGFVNDYAYGTAVAKEVDGRFHVQVLIQMPVTQQVILCVSGLMVSIAHLFGASYDGWQCPIQRQT